MKRGLDHKNFVFYLESHGRPMESFKQRSNMISIHLKESLCLQIEIIKECKGRSTDQCDNPDER